MSRAPRTTTEIACQLVRAGLTQRAFAAIVGRDRVTVARWCAGAWPTPTEALLVACTLADGDASAVLARRRVVDHA